MGLGKTLECLALVAVHPFSTQPWRTPQAVLDAEAGVAAAAGAGAGAGAVDGDDVVIMAPTSSSSSSSSSSSAMVEAFDLTADDGLTVPTAPPPPAASGTAALASALQWASVPQLRACLRQLAASVTHAVVAFEVANGRAQSGPCVTPMCIS